ncbi:MAG TPA: GNAT family N-acetyltransferase [Actinoplanes sp.]|jgi:GNAT superfamily N-acetyltransferase
MITLREEPRLVPPTTTVRISYLTGEQADRLARGDDTDWLGPASEDFHGFVDGLRGVVDRWGVPSSLYWYVAGEHYLGTLVIRHELTPELLVAGGHVGYHVVTAWRRQGHATRMLEQGLVECRRLGLTRVLLTCEPDNEASQRVILANGGRPDATLGDELRYWIDTDVHGREGEAGRQ